MMQEAAATKQKPTCRSNPKLPFISTLSPESRSLLLFSLNDDKGTPSLQPFAYLVDGTGEGSLNPSLSARAASSEPGRLFANAE